MRVFLLEDHELPLIDGFALVRTGNLFDPPDKHGLGEITADVMRSGGTHAKTGDQTRRGARERRRVGGKQSRRNQLRA